MAPIILFDWGPKGSTQRDARQGFPFPSTPGLQHCAYGVARQTLAALVGFRSFCCPCRRPCRGGLPGAQFLQFFSFGGIWIFKFTLSFSCFSGVEEPQKNKSQSWHTLFAGVLIALKNALFTRVYKNQVDNIMGLFARRVKKPAKAWILCTPHPHLPWRMPSCAEEAPPRQTIKKEKDLRICKQSRGYGNI